MAVVNTLIGHIKGPKGDTGETGATGATGAAGADATVTVGSTTTVPYGQTARVTNTGTPGAAVFNFTIPQGKPGEQTTKLDALTLDALTEPSASFPVPAIGDNGSTLFGKISKWFSDMSALVATKFNAANVVNNLLTTASGYALDARQGNVLNSTRTFSLTAEQEYSVGTLGDKTLYRKYLHYSGVTAATNTEVLLSSQSLPSTAAHVSVNAQSMVKNGDLALPANSMYTVVYRTSRGLCFRQGFTSSGTWEFFLWIEYTKS